ARRAGGAGLGVVGERRAPGGRAARGAERELVHRTPGPPGFLGEAIRTAHAIVGVPALVRAEQRATVLPDERVGDVLALVVAADRDEVAAGADLLELGLHEAVAGVVQALHAGHREIGAFGGGDEIVLALEDAAEGRAQRDVPELAQQVGAGRGVDRRRGAGGLADLTDAAEREALGLLALV